MTIGNYSIIYADPPWQYQRSKVQGAAENHYPTMGIDELCALPVADLAAPDSALFLWATFPQLPEALRLIEAWGFRYKSVAFVWLKKNKKADSWFYGLGFWTRGNAEICLLATRGHPKRQAANIHQFIISPIEAHSKKPDEAREKIVALMGDLPRVELFARQSPPGWEVWGNEVKSTIPDFGLMGPPQNQRFCGERRNNGADGLRDKVSRGISFLSAPTQTRATSTITFISIQRPLTAPGSSIILSAPALLCGGSLTGCALSMTSL